MGWSAGWPCWWRGGEAKIASVARGGLSKASRRAAVRVARVTGLERTARRHVVPLLERTRAATRGYSSPEQKLWGDLKRDIHAATAGGPPLVVGPWLSEVGFEALYWVPFLRWMRDKFELDPELMTAVSRGGTSSWYSGICASYVDIFELMSVEDFREHTDARWRAAGGQKQMEFGRWDKLTLHKAGDRLGGRRYGVLSPSLMYRFFHRFWKGAAPIRHITSHSSYALLERPEGGEWHSRLPEDDYVAVKFYFRPSFPDTPHNREVVSDIVAGLADQSPVVLLNTGLKIDDHVDLDPGVEDRVVRLLDGVPPELNLHVQALAISRANAFVGTYGGLSYLAPLYGLPSIACYSDPEHFLPSHLAVARRAAAAVGGSITALDVRRLDLMEMLADGRD
jgi:hypothetical protein